MSLNPSRVKPISNNLVMRIPCITTQKWYYLRGSEDKDVEYGRLMIAVASPLANVTSGSTTSLIIRMRWKFEFSFPDMPTQSLPDEEIFASAPNYFTDSSSDWKAGKYLTFKWHEGGNIVSFPGAKPKSIYKIGASAQIGYYMSNGTLANTTYVVCVPETTEDGLPMLAPVKDLTTAQAWVKSPSDSLLLPYYSAGPWISPENPPYHEQSSSISLILCSRETLSSPLVHTQSTVRVSDSGVAKTAQLTLNDMRTINGLPGGNPRSKAFGFMPKGVGANTSTLQLLKDTLARDGDKSAQDYGLMKEALAKLTELSFTSVPLLPHALNVFSLDPVRGDPESSGSSSSFEEVTVQDGQG